MNLFESTTFNIGSLLSEAILNESVDPKALTKLFETEFYEKLGFERYEDLDEKQKQKLRQYIEDKKKEAKELVDKITDDNHEQAFIYRILAAKDQKLPEDFDDINTTIQNFKKIKNSTNFKGGKDIGSYKDFRALHKAVYYFMQTASRKHKDFDIGRKVAETDQTVVYELLNKNFADFSKFVYDNGIAWCIKARSYWDTYKAPYYYFERDDKPYSLYNFNSNQYKDVHDHEIKNLDEDEMDIFVQLKNAKIPVPDKLRFSLALHENPDADGNELFLGAYPEWNLDENNRLVGDTFTLKPEMMKNGRMLFDFGSVSGDFICKDCGLTTLEGSPRFVGGNFDCSGSQSESSGNKLASLKGAPEEVSGVFNCSFNLLTTMEHCPSKAASVDCRHNQLVSLEGLPETLIGSLQCSRNKLASLEGSPFKIGKNFNCSFNETLSSLEGGPDEVGSDFECSHCRLKTLRGGPRNVGGYYFCTKNGLTSLAGAPDEINNGGFSCSYNELTTLKGSPRKISSYFYCSRNKLTSLVGGPEEVGGGYSCTKNDLQSLDGKPTKLGGQLNTSDNPGLEK